MKRFLAKHSPLVLLAVLCIVLGFVSENFRTPHNLQLVSLRTCVVAIIAAGQLLVILTAGIDLSVGSVAALANVVAALSMKEAGVPVEIAVILGSAVGMICGTVNGVLITLGRIPPFIVTLGMMMVARGLAMLITDATPIYTLPDRFDYLGGTRGWWIPVIIACAIIAIITVMLSLTRFGRSLYAIGGNLSAARLSGISVDALRVAAYALCGLSAGFAGVMLSSQVGMGDPNAGQGYELDSIAACVIGGTSLMGGEGTAVGALAGALIMNVLVNFCNLNNINVYWQQVLVGSLIVALVFYDNYRKHKAGLVQGGK
ncbi:MAG: hypothetical protein AMXMBFR84_41310 [Candidatus Hydrogenedentota bacterium]